MPAISVYQVVEPSLLISILGKLITSVWCKGFCLWNQQNRCVKSNTVHFMNRTSNIGIICRSANTRVIENTWVIRKTNTNDIFTLILNLINQDQPISARKIKGNSKVLIFSHFPVLIILKLKRTKTFGFKELEYWSSQFTFLIEDWQIYKDKDVLNLNAFYDERRWV